MACFSSPSLVILLLLPLMLPTLQVHSQSVIQQPLPNLAKILHESGHTKLTSLLCSTEIACYTEQQLNYTLEAILFCPNRWRIFQLK
ncbi:hypothetical protein Scep_028166 [Stephania cephalantha]|uniref:Uncharacterized protein n=1 Tax=Stephania cephalantha TaxID=152367 RepID=A0AAP0HJA2_9MAGN